MAIQIHFNDRISWRSGEKQYTGLFISTIPAAAPASKAIRQIDPNAEIPLYLMNLGRERTAERRIVLQVTHKLSGKDWAEYGNHRIKAFNESAINAKLTGVKAGGKDQFFTETPDIEWIEAEQNAGKKKRRQLEIEDIDGLQIAGL